MSNPRRDFEQQEPGPAALLARSFRSSVVADLRLVANQVDDEAASLHAFLSNLNSTCLHRLDLTCILRRKRSGYYPWIYYEGEADHHTPEYRAQLHKEDEAIYALSAFIRRSMPARAGVQHPTRSEELAPSFCGCPNLSTIIWHGKKSLARGMDREAGTQQPSLLILMTALLGYLVHSGCKTAAPFEENGLGSSEENVRKIALSIMGRCKGYDRLLLPSDSLQFHSSCVDNLDSSQVAIDSSRIRKVLRSVRLARRNVPRATAHPSTHLDFDDLEAAVDLDTEGFARTVNAVASSGKLWKDLLTVHSRMLALLLREVQRSAFIVLAAARTLGCQVDSLANTRKQAKSAWLRLPPELRSLCMQFLDEIYVPGFGDLGTGHALSRSQMQAILSFASDRRTIGYGRVSEVFLASKRLADEAAVEEQYAAAYDESRADQPQISGRGTFLPTDIFASPEWSWKKAAERCMPQDWVSHALWNKRPFPTSKHRVNGHGGFANNHDAA